MILSCWLAWYVWFKVVHLSHVDQSGNFIYKNKIEFMVFPLYILSYQSHMLSTWNPMHMSLGYMLSLIKFCDPSWFYSIYALDLRLYVQMNLMLLKYCLTRWKDGMPKKHDPKKKREKREKEKMACQRSMTLPIKSDMKGSMYLSVR